MCDRGHSASVENLPCPSSSRESHTRFSVYLGSSGGTRSVPFASAFCLSAFPLPCASHTPPHATITGSSAVTSPLAGTDHFISFLPTFSCTYGSRLETTYIGRSLRCALMNSCRRSAVHGLSSFSRRMRASSEAEERACRRLFDIFDISLAKGIKNASSPGASDVSRPPKRVDFTDSTNLRIGRRKKNQMRRPVAPENTKICTARRTRFLCHTSMMLSL